MPICGQNHLAGKCLRALLKPAAANSFASNMKTIAPVIMKARWMCADAKHEAAASDYTATCHEYVQAACKHSAAAAMTALPQQLGDTQARELQYVDDALFKPVAARVFEHMSMMLLLKRGW